MKLLEYEAKEILRNYTISIPKSQVVVGLVENIITPIVLKSQVPTGGRGKLGGIRLVNTDSEISQELTSLFTHSIKGFVPQKILAEELLNIDKEFYLSILVNRDSGSTELVANKSGGVEVEDNDPESFLRIPLNQQSINQTGEQIAELYNLPSHTFILQDMIKNLLDCFIQNDAVLIEINPLILTKDQNLIAGDCKMELDDTASFRHPEWDFEDKSADVNFVTLNYDGNVALIANGAGLGMASVDAVADAGMKPANFLDIGGGATSESILQAFNRIAEFPNVKVIVINIFAGITRCEEVAKAIIEARSKIDNLPVLSIRLAGTNFEQAVELLSQENISTFSTLEESLSHAKEVVYG